MPLLEYELRTHHPTKRGNVRLRVEESGEVFATKNRQEPVAGDWADDWGAALRHISDPDATVTALLDAGGFFSLPAAISGTGQGGVRETLHYRGSRGDRTVVADRADTAAFQAVVSRLFHGLDVARDL